jgi:cadmium resistance protein CadD (predicted permease)
MLTILAVVGVTTASFVSTSFDNFMLLVGFYADERYARGRVLLGYATSTLSVVLLAHGAAAAAETAPPALLGYLGLIPLALGLVGLARLASRAPRQEATTGTGARGLVAVLGVMLANSGDTLAVFISLFADTAEGLEAWVLGTAMAGATGYAVLARWLVDRSGAAERLQRYSRVVLPLLLIGIGAYILANTPTDAIP